MTPDALIESLPLWLKVALWCLIPLAVVVAMLSDALAWMGHKNWWRTK